MILLQIHQGLCQNSQALKRPTYWTTNTQGSEEKRKEEKEDKVEMG